MRGRTVEIITVGNELLNGKTVNTNAHWLAGQLTNLGSTVKRGTTVQDDLTDIASAIEEALKRKPNFLITVGGIGPTWDDRTLEGLARALKLELIVNRRALAMVKGRYRDMLQGGLLDKAELTEARVKMATLPKGARPLPNPVGTAPGVLLKAKGASILCLPGVPGEMKAIFDGSVAPIIRRGLRRVYRYEESIHLSRILESTLAPLIDTVRAKSPDVYIKSHPRGIEGGVSKIELSFTASASRKNAAESRVRRAVGELKGLALKKGGLVEDAPA